MSEWKDKESLDLTQESLQVVNRATHLTRPTLARQDVPLCDDGAASEGARHALGCMLSCCAMLADYFGILLGRSTTVGMNGRCNEGKEEQTDQEANPENLTLQLR